VMTDAEKPKFVAVLTELALLKPGAKLTSEAHRAWWNALREKWTMEEFRVAAAHLRDAMEFMPNPFHFEQLRKKTAITAGEAWNLARKACGSAIQSGHVTHNGTSGNERIDRAVRAIGGFGVIAMCDTDKLHFLERRFAEHYEAISDADVARRVLPQIARESVAAALVNSKSMVRR
jgi:hypothetical protein